MQDIMEFAGVRTYLHSDDDLPFVSIIIVNYNGKCFLEKCFSSIYRLNYPSHRFEVIMVDNNSNDDSIAYVQKFFSKVKILALTSNYLFSGGNNRGAAVAKGDALVFLNNDVEVEKEWLRQLVNVAYSDSRIGVCGGKVLYMDAPNIIQFAGGYLHTLGGAISIYYRHENNFQQSIGPSGYIIGCSLLIKKDVFNLIGCFDEAFYMYGEESDLCWRVWLYGYSVMYTPSSIVYHVGGASRKDKLVAKKDYELKRGILDGRTISKTNLFHGNKNAILSLLKNLEGKAIPSSLIFSSVFLGVQMVNLVIDKKTPHILLIAKSFWWPIANFGDIYRKRVLIQSTRKVSDKLLFRKKVLISISQLIHLTIKSMQK